MKHWFDECWNFEQLLETTLNPSWVWGWFLGFITTIPKNQIPGSDIYNHSSQFIEKIQIITQEPMVLSWNLTILRFWLFKYSELTVINKIKEPPNTVNIHMKYVSVLSGYLDRNLCPSSMFHTTLKCVPTSNLEARVNQHRPVHHEGWMVSGQETGSCWVPVP